MTPLYLFAAMLIWVLWGLSWFAAAFWAGRPAQQADRSSYRGPLALVFVGFAMLFVMIPRWSVPMWSMPAWFGWVLAGCVFAGMAFAWWARIHLGSLWSGGIVTREGHRIVESGPYALVRHPIYTGLILGASALAAIRATPLAVLGAVLMATGFAIKARVEERFLAAELGEMDDAAYRARVPMLVPFAPTHG